MEVIRRGHVEDVELALTGSMLMVGYVGALAVMVLQYMRPF